MYRNTLRFALVPTRDFDEKLQGLLEFCEQGEIDDVMFFIAAEELAVGHIKIEEAKVWTDCILRAKNMLKERGILISLNPWCTFAHYDGGRKLKDGQNFRTMVGFDGTRADISVCPLDENWRKYYVELMNFYVETLEPDILWLEDDFRLTNHEPVSFGCFCEEHMKLFNARMGTDYDLPTLRKKIFHDKEARKTLIDVSAYTMTDTLEYIVSHIPNQKTFGLMTSGLGSAFLEGRRYEKLYKIMEQNGKKPYNRLCLHAYREVGAQQYAWNLNTQSMWYRSVEADRANFVSELESYPHSLYTKSAGFTKYQLLTSAPLCLCGMTLSIFEFNGNGVVDGEKYASAIKEVKPFLSKIDDLGLSPTNAEGIYVLYSEESPYHIQASEEQIDSLIPKDSWWFGYLEMLGISCKYTTNARMRGKIVALYGQVLNNYDDETVCALFENNFVLINATAAEILVNRGLGALIGAESCEYFKERAGGYAMEELATDEKVLGVKKLRATSQFFCGDYLRIRYVNKDRQVYTNVLDYKEEVTGEGIVRSKNALIFPYTGQSPDYPFPLALICPLREYVIKKALKECKEGEGRKCFVSEPNVCPYMFKRGDKTYVLLVNFAEDTYGHAHMYMDVEYEKIKVITPERKEFRTVGFEYEEGAYRINQEIPPRSAVLLCCSME